MGLGEAGEGGEGGEDERHSVHDTHDRVLSPRGQGAREGLRVDVEIEGDLGFDFPSPLIQ